MVRRNHSLRACCIYTNSCTIIGQPVVKYASGAPCMVGKFAYGGAQRTKAADGVLGSWKRKDNVERVQVFVDVQG